MEYPLKKDKLQDHRNLGRLSSFSSERKPRSRFPWRLLPMRLGYLQWISIVVVFSIFTLFFQAFLPGSVVDEPRSSTQLSDVLEEELMYLKEIGDLDFGEGVRFEPSRILIKFEEEAKDMNSSYGSRRGVRFAYRKPKLALVFADLLIDPYQILMANVAAALQGIGYSIEVFSSEDGPAHIVWQQMGVPVTLVEVKDHAGSNIDWLDFNGVLLNSLAGKNILSCLMQEPFSSLPLVWTIHERSLATYLKEYTSNGSIEILNDWKKRFSHATVVVFPNYALPMIYSAFDTGNYFVIPGTPTEAWEADSLTIFDRENLLVKMGLDRDDLVVAVVSSAFMYNGLWLEHALILQALKPLLAQFPSDSTSHSGLKIFILTSNSTANSTANYTKAVEGISTSLKYPEGVVKLADRYTNADDVLRASQFVIYGSFLEEPSFPDILIKAMSYEKLVIAPRLSMIQKYVDDRVNGYLFPKENIEALTAIVSRVVSNGKLSPLAQKIASIGKQTAKNFMVAEAIEGYAYLLQRILNLPSEVAAPKLASQIDPRYKNGWRWDILSKFPDARHRHRNVTDYLDNIEARWSPNKMHTAVSSTSEDELLYPIWEDQKQTDIDNSRMWREEDELKARTDQSRGTWEDVYRNAKRAERSKKDLRERDDKELERTGQPLCIYEPYLGKGTWPFLHDSSLYRGINLGSKGQRHGGDDIDASSRLPLLENPYYRDMLREFGAFFAIANRVDDVHKNAWIGFQSWRATARKEALSSMAEKALLESIESHEHGDALYFWIRMEMDRRNPLMLDFWSFCDSINAGNCRSGFSDALKKMYGIEHDFSSVPHMPIDGDSWSVMYSWALPTRSFLEFVMFARMFADALDAQMYDEHLSRLCYFSLSKDKQCYSRVLELLINIWAYHSGRRMVYVNPQSGVMHEQHSLEKRRGLMLVKWFSFQTLKSMDEDLAEEADLDNSKRQRWLWPETGEVYWQGTHERERSQKKKDKAEKKRRNKERMKRIIHRNQQRQKPIGKYVKPQLDGMSSSNITKGMAQR